MGRQITLYTINRDQWNSAGTALDDLLGPQKVDCSQEPAAEALAAILEKLDTKHPIQEHDEILSRLGMRDVGQTCTSDHSDLFMDLFLRKCEQQPRYQDAYSLYTASSIEPFLRGIRKHPTLCAYFTLPKSSDWYFVSDSF